MLPFNKMTQKNKTWKTIIIASLVKQPLAIFFSLLHAYSCIAAVFESAVKVLESTSVVHGRRLKTESTLVHLFSTYRSSTPLLVGLNLFSNILMMCAVPPYCVSHSLMGESSSPRLSRFHNTFPQRQTPTLRHQSFPWKWNRIIVRSIVAVILHRWSLLLLLLLYLRDSSLSSSTSLRRRCCSWPFELLFQNGRTALQNLENGTRLGMPNTPRGRRPRRQVGNTCHFGKCRVYSLLLRATTTF
jgi:hypothetical protein